MPTLAFTEHFAPLQDPRVERGKHHLLLDIVVIAFCAVLCGAEGWEDIEDFGLAKQDWLKDRLGLALPHGIPSDDTFRRLFARLDPHEFGRCLASFAQSLHQHTQGEVIALDGKTLRHSFDAALGQSAIHLLSAWASEQGLSLGQVRVDEKSNEITALPVLLKMLDIAGCVVTCDAMGCQKAIAEQIVEQKGDYVFCLKGNQTSLHEDVRTFFEEARAQDFFASNPDQAIVHRSYVTRHKDHGRLETRRYTLVEGDQIAWLAQKPQWAGLRSIGAVESQRQIGQKVQKETPYFISSLCGSIKRFAQAVRAHWGIENRLHWVLDVAFGEDACPIVRDHAPENLAILRRLVLNLLRQDKTHKRGLKAKSKIASWDNDYLLRLLLSMPQEKNN